MELDAHQLADGAVLDADCVIIGAGPAGLTLARELAGTRMDILLVESGGAAPEPWAQSLNEGAVVGSAYAGLSATRHRRIGGTTHLWNTPVHDSAGGKYAPLDPTDFEPARGQPGWAFAWEELIPFYRRAQAICSLGPFAYDASDWTLRGREPFRTREDALLTRVYQFGPSRPFTDSRGVSGAGNVRVCRNATVRRLTPGPDGRRIAQAQVGSSTGRWQTVRAKCWVLAGGAIENARLLLVSELPNPHDLIGRFFMEHPRDYSLTLTRPDPALYRDAAYYDQQEAADGTVIGGRLALSPVAIRSGLPNASITLLPKVVAPDQPGLMGRMFSRLRAKAESDRPDGYGWSRAPDLAQRAQGFRLLINLEQRPHPENRVALGSVRDGLGVPRAELRWRWRREELDEIDRLRRFIAASLEQAGVGRVENTSDPLPDGNAHHHSGTTRMHRDPRQGVVDPDGLVHGSDNLYVAGSSVFPRAGFANPTLTIVALAARLADHLKARLGG